MACPALLSTIYIHEQCIHLTPGFVLFQHTLNIAHFVFTGCKTFYKCRTIKGNKDSNGASTCVTITRTHRINSKRFNCFSSQRLKPYVAALVVRISRDLSDVTCDVGSHRHHIPPGKENALSHGNVFRQKFTEVM